VRRIDRAESIRFLWAPSGHPRGMVPGRGPHNADTEFTLTDFVAGCNLSFHVAHIGTPSFPSGFQGEVSVGESISYKELVKRWPAG
jgi:hypothetical protein